MYVYIRPTCPPRHSLSTKNNMSVAFLCFCFYTHIYIHIYIYIYTYISISIHMYVYTGKTVMPPPALLVAT